MMRRFRETTLLVAVEKALPVDLILHLIGRWDSVGHHIRFPIMTRETPRGLALAIISSSLGVG